MDVFRNLHETVAKVAMAADLPAFLDSFEQGQARHMCQDTQDRKEHGDEEGSQHTLDCQSHRLATITELSIDVGAVVLGIKCRKGVQGLSSSFLNQARSY